MATLVGVLLGGCFYLFRSELVAYHLEDGIATLTLQNGKVNAVSHEVIDAFNQALDQAEQDRAVVIITCIRLAAQPTEAPALSVVILEVT